MIEVALTVTSPSAFATGHFSVQASGGILSPSKEPPRPPFDKLRAGPGSTSLATDAGGGFLSRMLYYPYGETRHTQGTLPTDYRFAGQRAEMGLGGLYDYHARFHDPEVLRLMPGLTFPEARRTMSRPWLWTKFLLVWKPPSFQEDR